jgi:hypothetical protein
VDTDHDPVFDWGIPRGDVGATPVLEIGDIITLAPGADATANITGTPESPVLNLALPAGVQGEQGEQGDDGPMPQLTVGTVLTGDSGTAAGASIVGTPPNFALNLVIPRGHDVDPTVLQAILDRLNELENISEITWGMLSQDVQDRIGAGSTGDYTGDYTGNYCTCNARIDALVGVVQQLVDRVARIEQECGCAEPYQGVTT